MKQDVKVSFCLKKNEMKEDGKCPVMARLTVGNTRTVFSAKMTVQAKMWPLGRAAGKSLRACEINRQLDGIRASAIIYYRELSAVLDKVTAEDVKTLVLGMAFGQDMLLAWFRNHNKSFDKRVGANRKKETAKSYRNALAHVTRFVESVYHLSDIPFTALDRSFIDKFDHYLRTEAGHAPGTIVLNTTRLNTIVGKAVAEGIITADPFADYQAERPERKQKYLTRKELDALNVSNHAHDKPQTLPDPRSVPVFLLYRHPLCRNAPAHGRGFNPRAGRNPLG